MIGPYDALPGPGDSATWPAYSGHPNDPRGPSLNSREQHDLDRESEQLAAEGFDALDDYACDWIENDVVQAAISYLRDEHPDRKDDLRKAVENLRERYVTECASLYEATALDLLGPQVDEDVRMDR